MSDLRAHARRTDPSTSHQAAASVNHKLRESHQHVLLVMRDHGDMTDEELVEFYGYAVNRGVVPSQSQSGIRTRRRELTDMGRVMDTGRKRKLKSGRNAIVWRVV
jgi:hypothetical protein